MEGKAKNIAEMREALGAALYCLQERNTVSWDAVEYAIGKIKSALAAPLRNCDIYDAREAMREFAKQTGSKSIRAKSVKWLLKEVGT